MKTGLKLFIRRVRRRKNFVQMIVDINDETELGIKGQNDVITAKEICV